MTTQRNRKVIEALVDRAGTTWAQEAGIRLADEPAPLYQLAVLSTLLSARIDASIAAAAARELFAAGMGTPQGMLDATWQDRVDALGRGHYRRYDERTATMLGRGARYVLEEWRGDLRTVRPGSPDRVDRFRAALEVLPGIGPAGSAIFCREVQGVWPEIAPFADRAVGDGARSLGLPHTGRGLAPYADDFPRLAAALVRAARDDSIVAEVRAA
ncbi:endonuclease [Isoptericola sp. b441]|uniref:Endonuclease n=1 Tax=Actinotalea lenta TaxID=3064654 RepID=A0ABT9DF74_9CELL|nr:endonuclease [Isoptericola sp. b441]MDO8108207.1 endonuclease [Isoptericola sp. b441]